MADLASKNYEIRGAGVKIRLPAVVFVLLFFLFSWVGAQSGTFCGARISIRWGTPHAKYREKRSTTTISSDADMTTAGALYDYDEECGQDS